MTSGGTLRWRREVGDGERIADEIAGRLQLCLEAVDHIVTAKRFDERFRDGAKQ